MLDETIDQTTVNTAINPFMAGGIVNLATVRDRAVITATGTRQRDLASAFRFVEARLQVDLAATPATATILRSLFAAASPVALGIASKRIENVRSIVTKAVERYGMPSRFVTRRVDLTPAWATLIGQIERKEYRCAHSRLACYCSANGIEPADVTPETLRGLHAALVEESLVKEPRKLLKHTIALWNMAMKEVPMWPSVRLTSPFVEDPLALPLSRFPLPFQADVADWARVMTHPDPLDLGAPIRALRPSTLKGAELMIRRFASALVREGIVPIEGMTSLATFFENDHLQKGLRSFLAIDGAGRRKTTLVASRVAARLVGIARDYCHLDPARLEELRMLSQRLDPKRPRVMGERSRRRLEQFDGETAKQKLLHYPEQQARRALEKTNPMRRARAFEQALAASISLFACLRIENLRTLRLDRHVRKTHDGMMVMLAANEVKNAVPLKLALPPETEALFDRFVADHRLHLAGHGGPYLFPGKDDGPKSDNAMRAALIDPIRKHTGLNITPHILRHASAKILVDEDPTLIAAVSQMLGHKSINTTIQNYLGTQSRAAGRKLAGVLRGVRDGTPVRKKADRVR